MKYIIKMHSDLIYEPQILKVFGELKECTDPDEMKKGYCSKNDKYIIQIDNTLEEK